MSRPVQIKRFIQPTIIVLLLVMLVSAWPLRSWIRSTLAPTVFSGIHMPQVTRHYTVDFGVINDYLRAKNFQLIDKTTLPYDDRDGLNSYEPLDGCRTVGYQGFGETIYCQKIGEYKPASPQAFKAAWPGQAAGFQKLLDDEGWHKQYSDQPDYVQLLDVPSDSGNWLTYVKNNGKIVCELTVAYNPPYQNPDDQIWIHEQCVREIALFGGY